MFSLHTYRAIALVALAGCGDAGGATDALQTDTGAADAGGGTGVSASSGGSGGAGTTTGGSSTGSVEDASVPPEVPPAGLAFPKGFAFGTAIAGFQVDMGCPTLARAECEDKASDWFAFTTAKETTGDKNAHLSGQNPSDVGPGFWELYEDDIKRVDEELHNNALRMSIEWSRIFPTPTDGIEGVDALAAKADSKAVAHYHAVFSALKKHNVRPLVTLYHYALPTWIHDAVGCHSDFDNCSPKGWVDAERTLREIQKFAAFCAREFGAEVDWWATLNEPLQNALFGYVQPGEQRSHPPAVSLKTAAAKIVFNALIDAHARMYDAVKANDRSDADGDGKASFIGVVYPLVPIEPANPNSAFGVDKQAAENIDYLWNRAFLNAVALGKYDAKLDKKVVQRKDLEGRMDYVGINYYFSMKVSGLGFAVPIISDISPLFTANPLDFKDLPNEPAKLGEFIRWVNKDLGKPAIITENGTVDPDDDGTTPRFLVQNLKAVVDATEAGADVRGYFYWSLMDNYEWNHGMDMRFGLYAVDKADPMKRRTARKAVPVYAQIAKFGVLPYALINLHTQTN